jgi:Uma2 family endonuclease
MATVNPPRATPDDLMRTQGKAELIAGKVVRYMPSGFLPGLVASNILFGLGGHARARGAWAFSANMVYVVPILGSGRESFSADASYYDGPLPANPMGPIPGPPTFAAEVREAYECSPRTELEIAAKRADYFAAGTQVVWDVDPVAETINCYLASAPDQPIRFVKGQDANAEPAVPGWRIPVAEVFALSD